MSRGFSPEVRAAWVKWAAVQFASIYCIVNAVFLLICAMTRHAFGATTAPYVPHMLLLAALFYALHWRLQGRAFALDPVRSDLITALIKMQPSQYDKDF